MGSFNTDGLAFFFVVGYIAVMFFMLPAISGGAVFLLWRIVTADWSLAAFLWGAGTMLAAILLVFLYHIIGGLKP